MAIDKFTENEEKVLYEALIALNPAGWGIPTNLEDDMTEEEFSDAWDSLYEYFFSN